MGGESYSEVIRRLSTQYYRREMNFEEYRSQRRTLLGLIDQQYNSAEAVRRGAGTSRGETITFKNPNYPF